MDPIVNHTSVQGGAGHGSAGHDAGSLRAWVPPRVETLGHLAELTEMLVSEGVLGECSISNPTPGCTFFGGSSSPASVPPGAINLRDP